MILSMSLNPKAYSQVSYILNNISSELKNKIPREIISLIEKKKDTTYKINIDNIEDLELLEDTEKILSVIYTDFIATEEERKIIKNKEKMTQNNYIRYKKENVDE